MKLKGRVLKQGCNVAKKNSNSSLHELLSFQISNQHNVLFLVCQYSTNVDETSGRLLWPCPIIMYMYNLFLKGILHVIGTTSILGTLSCCGDIFQIVEENVQNNTMQYNTFISISQQGFSNLQWLVKCTIVLKEKFIHQRQSTCTSTCNGSEEILFLNTGFPFVYIETFCFQSRTINKQPKSWGQ